jgi:hypothetical protein
LSLLAKATKLQTIEGKREIFAAFFFVKKKKKKKKSREGKSWRQK